MHPTHLLSLNNYHIGDLIYVEENPQQPYVIAKITNINESKGKVDIRVYTYYRRRDMTQSNLQRVDRHTAYLSANEHSYEWNHPECPYTKEEIHNIRLRELITSRGDDDISDRKISPNMIRGKCHMSRYCPLENAFSYLGKSDLFYFSAVFEPDTRNVSIEGNDIGIGSMHQASIPDIDINYIQNTENIDTGEIMWDPRLFSKYVDKDSFNIYTKLIRSICVVGRLVDPTYSCKYGSIRQIASIASRDSSIEYALYFLHKNGYNVSETVKKIVSNLEEGDHMIVHDSLDFWNTCDIDIFQKNVMLTHKDFSLIQKKYLPWKSTPELVEFYYLWKTTTGYDRMKRKQEAKIMSLFVPNRNDNVPNTFTIPHQKLVTISQESSRTIHHVQCVSCKTLRCDYWYNWIPSGIIANKSTKYYLCPECWLHWKKYGGLKRPDPLDRSCTEEAALKCLLCNKIFQRTDRFNTHIFNNHPYRCPITPCPQYYDTKDDVDDHTKYSHFIGIHIPELPPKLLKKRKFYFVSYKKWSKLRRKIFKKNPHLCVININQTIPDLQKLIIEGFGIRRPATFLTNQIIF